MKAGVLYTKRRISRGYLPIVAPPNSPYVTQCALCPRISKTDKAHDEHIRKDHFFRWAWRTAT